RPGAPKNGEGGAAGAEDRLFFAASESRLDWMNLHDSSDRQGAHLHEPQPPEVACLQDVYSPLVAEENIRLVLEGMPIDGPEAPPEPIVIQRHAMVRVVHMVIIDRGQ